MSDYCPVCDTEQCVTCASTVQDADNCNVYRQYVPRVALNFIYTLQ